MPGIRWLSEYYPSRVPGFEVRPKVPKRGDFNQFTADVEVADNWELSELTCAPDLGQCT